MIRLPGGAGFSLGTGCHPLPSLRGCRGVQYTGSHRLPVYWPEHFKVAWTPTAAACKATGRQ
jgi:hypothetical protein